MAEPSAKVQKASATPTVDTAIKKLEKLESNVQVLAAARKREKENVRLEKQVPHCS